MRTINVNPITGTLWVVGVGGLERLAYYGFRAILVLFLVDQVENGGMDWTNREALELYGIFTLSVYLSGFIGGVLADLIFGAYKTMILGAVLLLIGYVGFSIVNENLLMLSLVLVALGTGLFKPNIPAIITHQLSNTPERFDSMFTCQYLIVNIGAALSPLIVGILGESIGWGAAFTVCAFTSVIMLLLLITTKKLFSSANMNANLKCTSNFSASTGIGVLFISCALAMVFWTIFELGSYKIYETFRESSNSLVQMFAPVTVIITCIVCIVFWSVFKISYWIKIAISFLLFCIRLVSYFTSLQFDNGEQPDINICYDTSRCSGSFF